MFVDTHAHIYSEYYTDIDGIIKQSAECGVKYIINSGVDHKTNVELLTLSKKYSTMFITLGIHPENVDSYNNEDLLFIEENLQNDKVVAIGEIGLDYHYEGYDKKKQIELFCSQLQLAEKYQMPVVVHSRDATQDTINILKQYNVKGVIHSFSGSYEIAREYIDMGFMLGINGVVTFKNAHIKEVIKKIGIDYFVLETDSPYLTPSPFRGQKNFPGNIKHIISFLKEYLNISSSEIARKTNANIKSIFDKFHE